ncbi:dTDP-4-amino-4,6-dideoxygalactose transaminase [Franzmannia qiaohouensis]|uniref:dTDP-4-amino-4,6-dideoxygalactose transaminase n=1 Tax=Franzmannia qiaohouensis TaxID=1329370 RepID=A0ABU1HJ27_9GAMM|nr:dTDP-4-amino-4,6-dideoxygalactose transaminase [Halomonas qiaohouensis]MDR5907492.1 dTDP-4-amino-4,6-dideoxygalactose transaminase [Halomonas qiaohouensis]
MIPFNKPAQTGREEAHLLKALSSGKLSGDGEYSLKCHEWFERNLPCKRALLTPSCTQALELAAILIDIKPGDEVIMPSYTFVSTANAFVLRGAKAVFVDIRPDTMNIDEAKIEASITDKTKAIVPVHYAGVACDMNAIMSLAERYGLYVIEDAAQGMMSEYEGRQLGTIGHMAAYSFHETKNYTSGGEGGLLIINDSSFQDRAEIIREKGTNRSLFFRGLVDKYSWVDVGSSYLPSELQAAYLWGQLENVNEINNFRLSIWEKYHAGLAPLKNEGLLDLPSVPSNCKHNAHMYYIKVKDLDERKRLIHYLKERDIMAVFHYVPLHTAKAGVDYGRFSGKDVYTSNESERLLRLPMWFNIPTSYIDNIIDAVLDFYH